MDFTVFIKELNGRITRIRLLDNEFESVTVLQLKEKIQTLTGYPVDQQRLIFGGKQLEDDRLLVSYGIQHKSTIYIVPRLRGFDPSVHQGRDGMRNKDGINRKMDFTVFIKELNGRITRIRLPDNEFESVTVLQLKEKIQTETEFPVDQQRLIFGGKQLEDDRLLVSYGIQHKSTIYIVPRLRGFDPSVHQGRDGMRNKDGINRTLGFQVDEPKERIHLLCSFSCT
ncbi:polyubiquitin-like [Centropristis striata]|uniref:polyubiquitin-like n=1 Tax=Centropristis striata TaxID=184440 RepID=UPI0027E19A35|nr:polyubiquitin-like [Centropristis striata]